MLPAASFYYIYSSLISLLNSLCAASRDGKQVETIPPLIESEPMMQIQIVSKRKEAANRRGFRIERKRGIEMEMEGVKIGSKLASDNTGSGHLFKFCLLYPAEWQQRQQVEFKADEATECNKAKMARKMEKERGLEQSMPLKVEKETEN